MVRQTDMSMVIIMLPPAVYWYRVTHIALFNSSTLPSHPPSLPTYLYRHYFLRPDELLSGENVLLMQLSGQFLLEDD